MTEWIVDTNVPIVANGRPEPGEARSPTLPCREAAVSFLLRLATRDRVVLGSGGAIQAEYRTYLRPSGQPGVGDRFYQLVLHSSPERVRRAELTMRPDGEYDALPEELRSMGFDPSDRKFAALAHQERVAVVNATDSDWVNAATTLATSNIEVIHLCGCDPANWYTLKR